MAGRHAAGMPNRRSISSSQRRPARFINWVREALVASVAWTAPPVRFHSSQVSIVPAHRSPRSARRGPSAACSMSQRSLPAENSGSRPRPVRARTSGSAPRERSAAQNGAERRHCHTAQGPAGAEVARSQRATDSRWLAMPMAAISPAPLVAIAETQSAAASTTVHQRSARSCSTQAG